MFVVSSGFAKTCSRKVSASSVACHCRCHSTASRMGSLGRDRKRAVSTGPKACRRASTARSIIASSDKNVWTVIAMTPSRKNHPASPPRRKSRFACIAAIAGHPPLRSRRLKTHNRRCARHQRCLFPAYATESLALVRQTHPYGFVCLSLESVSVVTCDE